MAAAVADAHRREWGYVLAATVSFTRDFDLAEECVQDAYARALTRWESDGIPRRTGAWLTTTARRIAVDVIRRNESFRRKMPELVVDDTAVEEEADSFPDDRLRLIFTCCHPALVLEAQVALTLRLLCGLTTAEVARAFLVSEPTMAARITRAKKKIANAHIPYRVPSRDDLPARLLGVLEVVHLLFTTGHSAPYGSDLVRAELVERSIELARMLRQLIPESPDAAGLLALILLTDARRATRTDPHGDFVLLADQDRSLWDRGAIDEGIALVREALRGRPPSRYALQAAIAAVHVDSPLYADTDWREIVALYRVLESMWPSPVVALNRAAATGFADGPGVGLAALEELRNEPQLAGYPYLSSTRAEFLRQLGRDDEARLAYEEALMLTENEAERRFLEDRLNSLGEM